jgi:predicted ATPase
MKASMTRAISLHTLGGLSLKGINFTRPKPLLLLTYLSLEGPQSRRHIAELFWPEASDHMKSLTVALVQIRQAGQNLIEADDTQLKTLVESDAKQLLTLLEQQNYRKALELYRGSFLEGFFLRDWGEELEEWVYKTREILAGRAREVMLKVAEQDAAKGLFEQAASRAEAAYRLRGSDLLEAEDTNRIYRLLVAGRNPYAAELAKEAEELGIAVSMTVSEAQAQLLDSNPQQTTHELPTYTTPFVGRKNELAKLSRLLLDDPSCRLLTLMGPGGIGKTRLALEAASSAVGAFSYGVFFIPLTPVSAASGIVPAIAETIGLQFYDHAPLKQQLLEYLANKHMLLLLDNFEHLISTEDLIADLLSAAPTVKLLVTSRESLRLQEEWAYSVEGLSFPKEADDALEYDALRLFEQSARRASVRFPIEAKREQIVKICQLVEGMPLALELAASWLKVTPIETVLQELEGSIDILSTRHQNVSERHQSMRVVLEGSWQLLNDEEQKVLTRLSVFRGGFRQAAAEAVGASLPLLATLIEKSWLRVNEAGRYQLHELVRQFVAEKLDAEDKEKTLERHSLYYLDLVGVGDAERSGSNQRAILAAISSDRDNVQAAWRWAAEHGHSHELNQAMASFYDFYDIGSHFQEGFELFDDAIRVLPQVAEHREVLAKLHLRRANFRLALGDYVAAKSEAQHSLTMAKDERERAFILRTLGTSSHVMGQRETSEHYFRESVAIFRKLSDPVGLALVLFGFSDMLSAFAEFEEGREVAREALAVSRTTGRADLVSLALGALAWPTSCLGNYNEAERYYQEGLELSRTLEDRNGIGRGLNFLGWMAFCRGPAHTAEAINYYEQALALYRAIHNRTSIAMCLGDLALALAEAGHYQEAMERGLEGFTLAKGIGHFDLVPYNLYILGAAALGLGQVEKSLQYLEESIRLSLSRESPDQTASALYFLAKLLVTKGQVTKAVQILAGILEQPTCWQAIKDRAKGLLYELESELPAKEFVKAKVEGQKQGLAEVARVAMSSR